MQAIADHVYHILIIAFVVATIVEAIAKVAKRPRKRKRTLNVRVIGHYVLLEG